MEQKFVRVPFEIELAKEITNGTKEGRIVTLGGKEVRILCFDANVINFPIVALIKEDGGDSLVTRTNDGKAHSLASDNDPRSLLIEIPEYMTFKDGDVLTCFKSEDRFSIFVYKKSDSDSLANYVECAFKDTSIIIGFDRSYYSSKFCRKATEEEIQKLIDALKKSKDDRTKEILKRFFGIEEKKECEFKPFDKVLVRDGVNDAWQCSLFSNYIDEYDGFKYITVTGMYKQCIPYNEKTTYLLGTTEDYKGD